MLPPRSERLHLAFVNARGGMIELHTIRAGCAIDGMPPAASNDGRLNSWREERESN